MIRQGSLPPTSSQFFNVGIARIIPGEEDIHLTVNETRYIIDKEDIPQIILGNPCQVYKLVNNSRKYAGQITLTKRSGYENKIVILIDNTRITIKQPTFMDFLNGRKSFLWLNEYKPGKVIG